MRAGEIVELNVFLAVAEEGRFAPAAVRLGVTASAVSQSIRRLEKRLMVRLFVRTTRSVALTEAGEALVRQVAPAFEQLTNAERLVTQRDSRLTGRARISVSTIAMELLIAPVLSDFRSAHPDFALEIFVEDKLVDPVARRYDAVIRRGDLLERDMIARRLSQDDQLTLVASPAYLDGRGQIAHPHDLDRDRIVIRRPRSGAALPWLLTRSGETVRIDKAPSLTVEGAIAARQFAAAGCGIALLPTEFVAAQLEKGTLCLVMPEWRCPLVGFHLMYPHRGGLPHGVSDLERAIRKHTLRQVPREAL